MHSWHNDMDRALIEPCPSYMLYHFLNSATIKKIVKETIGVGVNEKAVLRFYKTALSFTSISIFPW